MKTYIAGPMSPSSFGLKRKPKNWDWNHPAFNGMAKTLRDIGIDVLNPAEIDAADDPHLNQPWSFYLRRDLRLIAESVDRVVFLPGWQNSPGARLERHVAKALGCELVYPSQFKEWYKIQQAFVAVEGSMANA